MNEQIFNYYLEYVILIVLFLLGMKFLFRSIFGNSKGLGIGKFIIILHVTRYFPRVGQYGVSNFLEMYVIFIMILKSRMVVQLILLLLLLMGQLKSHQRIKQTV